MSSLDANNPYSSSHAADYAAEDIKQHFVELCETGIASEANALAAKLRRAGIIALANAERYRPGQRPPSRTGFIREHYRTFVMVFSSELDRAIEVLNHELGQEGDVPLSDIAQEIQAAQDDPDSAMAWYYKGSARHRQPARSWSMIDLGLFALAFGVAWLALS